MGVWLMAVLVLLFSGCGGGPAIEPATVVQVNVTASQQVNPDGEGRPSPVVTRIYFLQTPGRFETADFFTLFRNQAAALGESLVAVEELTLMPGMRQSFIREIKDEVGWIGVVAAYRDIDHALWRQLVAIPPHQTSLLEVRLKPLAVEVDLIEHR